ncbi:hypothetical protein DSO57_1032000 [Entomophthora muscae]|uniref:Uncharacterized protein n=1 Tax=Entomophthora muscae TaxID=34485 RepID=A0ACC2RRJ8_9FUNG|nr:hypothetical protein DSO57_1032000 [Entomophthora muscae]
MNLVLFIVGVSGVASQFMLGLKLPSRVDLTAILPKYGASKYIKARNVKRVQSNFIAKFKVNMSTDEPTKKIFYVAAGTLRSASIPGRKEKLSIKESDIPLLNLLSFSENNFTRAKSLSERVTSIFISTPEPPKCEIASNFYSLFNKPRNVAALDSKVVMEHFNHEWELIQQYVSTQQSISSRSFGTIPFTAEQAQEYRSLILGSRYQLLKNFKKNCSSQFRVVAATCKSLVLDTAYFDSDSVVSYRSITLDKVILPSFSSPQSHFSLLMECLEPLISSD